MRKLRVVPYAPPPDPWAERAAMLRELFQDLYGEFMNNSSSPATLRAMKDVGAVMLDVLRRRKS